MAAVVWFTVALAIWHFTVFVPDRFWGGIVGALLGAIADSRPCEAGPSPRGHGRHMAG